MTADIFLNREGATLWLGDCIDVLKKIPSASINCCVTSPPYWGLRDYGVAGQLGAEKTPEEYTAKMVEVFGEVRRVLRGDGTLWLNLGDTYVGGNRGANCEGSTLQGSSAYQGQSKAAGRVKPSFRRDRRNREDDPHKIAPGLKPKDLVGIPWRVAFALQADGWYLRSDIIWHKPNPMPESVTDRPTKSHEYIFLMAKSARYYYDAAAIAEQATGLSSGNGFNRPERISQDGRGDPTPWKANPAGKRNRRTVWTVTTQPYRGAHFATFPPRLIEPCVLAGSPEGGLVLDPFNGAGTTGLVSVKNKRRYVGIDLNPAYLEMTVKRIMPKFTKTSIEQKLAALMEKWRERKGN